MGADQRGIAIYRFVCGEGNGPTLCTDEPRDLYDLWFLMVEAGVDLSRLVGAIAEKLCFRQKDIAGIEDRILKKEQRLKALWTGRLGHQIEALPEFDAVFRAVRRELQAGIAG
jgi:hypothetical protein